MFTSDTHNGGLIGAPGAERRISVGAAAVRHRDDTAVGDGRNVLAALLRLHYRLKTPSRGRRAMATHQVADLWRRLPEYSRAGYSAGDRTFHLTAIVDEHHSPAVLLSRDPAALQVHLDSIGAGRVGRITPIADRWSL